MRNLRSGEELLVSLKKRDFLGPHMEWPAAFQLHTKQQNFQLLYARTYTAF